MNYPVNLQYTRTDEWVLIDGDLATVGISDYAQHELGDVVYVELPEVGAHVSAGVAFGVVESVKAVSDLLCPVAGEIIESNLAATDDPSRINASPYGDGWLLKVKLSSDAPTEKLMSATEYQTHRAR